MYGRSTEYNGVWAIMYAYYFPRDESATPFYAGRRHGWEHAIIWLDEKSENATITAVSASRFGNRYSTNAPPESNTVDGSSAKLEKIIMLGTHHYLKDTTFPGQFYDLVMWDDLTNAAREALETTDFNTKVPIIDDNFLSNLKKADPLETEE
ncbi:NPP1-like protein [Phytophthora palmivora]|uniref:NPP1-like protein n=1 Tax=Phytophthora palmivora TaxID=4796 RepID=A0A2P4WXG8_9STRA|nr:NPP1-like protein [Phytophthora palmivora]